MVVYCSYRYFIVYSYTLGNMFYNHWARRASIGGFVLNLGCLVWGLVFLFMSNLNGMGWNPFNDVRFCTAVTPVTAVPFYSNPLNGCKNTFLCPITILSNALGVNGNAKLTLIYIAFSLFYYIMVFAFTYNLQPQIDFYVASPEQAKILMAAQIEQTIEDLKYHGTVDEEQDYRNGLNNGLGQVLSVNNNNINTNTNDNSNNAFNNAMQALGPASKRKKKRSGTGMKRRGKSCNYK